MNTNNETNYLFENGRILYKGCSMQIIAFLEQSLYFLAENMKTIAYTLSNNRIK